MSTPTTLEIEFGGRTLTLETGKLAGLAGGAVTLRYGDTLVLGTANRSQPRPGLDFFPLTVEFEERMYAAGKIPGGFIKREGRMSEAATLAARLTDRPIRPLFPEGYKDDVQLVITVLSTDQENDPDILGTIAASAALTISEIPFQGPVGAVRVGRIDGEFVLNPTYTRAPGVRARPGRVRHPRRDHDGRGRGQDPPRGRDGRGDPVRPALAPAAGGDPGQAPRARRQAQAPAVPRAAHGLRAQVRRPGEGGRRVRRGGRRDDRHRSQDGRPRRGRRGARQGRQDHRPLVHAREPRAARSSATRCTASPTRTSRAPRARPRPPARRSSSSATRRSSATPSASTSPSSRRPSGTAPASPRARYLDTLVIAREGYPDLENYKLGTLANFFGVELSENHRALPDAEATANLLIWFGNDLPGRIEALKTGIADATRATRTDKDEAARLLEAARRDARFSKSLFGLVQKKVVRQLVLSEGIRMDGRATDEIRPISVEVGLLPRAHGSGLFTRGQTQALTVATLGPSSDVQRIDTISPELSKRYLHHYNFPPYSTGENKPMRGPSAAATSGTATSPPGRSCRSSRRRRSSRTSSASSPRSWPATAPPRWRRPAARPSP